MICVDVWPFCITLLAKTWDCNKNSSSDEQLRSLINCLLGKLHNHILWWQLFKGMYAFRSVGLKWFLVWNKPFFLKISRSKNIVWFKSTFQVSLIFLVLLSIFLVKVFRIIYVPSITDQLWWVITENVLPAGHKEICHTGSKARSHHHTPGLQKVLAIIPKIIVQLTKFYKSNQYKSNVFSVKIRTLYVISVLHWFCYIIHKIKQNQKKT